MGYPIISRAINFLLITLTAITIFSLAYTSHAAVFNVPAGDVPMLIAAITAANTNTETDTINLGGGTYTLTSGPFAADGDNGLPSILSDGGNPLTINGNGLLYGETRAFSPLNPATVLLVVNFAYFT